MSTKIMPKTITLDDGTEEEVYTADEVDGYKKGAEKNKERKEVLSKFTKNLEVEDEQQLIDKLSELQENANPNFAKYRAKFKSMEKALKDSGKEFDENGELVVDGVSMTKEDIQKQIEEGVKQSLSQRSIDDSLSDFNDEEKKIIKTYYQKLSTLGGDAEENLELAITKALPDQNIDRIKLSIANSGGGRPASPPKTDKSFSSTDKGLAHLQQLAPPGYEAQMVDGKPKLVIKK